MEKSTPISFLIENKETILQSFYQNGNKPKKSWQSLQKILPELNQTMRFNTFKQYLSVFAALSPELDRVTQKLEEAIKQKKELEGKVKTFKKELDKVTQTGKIDPQVRQKLDNQPKRIDGWSVQKSKDGYYRCYRKIENRVHSIYIGKALDLEKARRCITEKEKALRLDMS